MRKPFADTLRQVRNGEVIEELDAKLQQLVQAVQSTGKGGTLTLTVEVKPMKDSTEAMVVKAEVKVKEPKFNDAGTVLFPTPEGNLERSHYKQRDLPGLSSVSAAA